MRSKVKNSKYAKRAIKRLIEENQEVFDSLARGIETYPVECGSTCGHFDFLNQCCWLSWRNKEEGDHCNYGLVVTADNVIFTPKELSEVKEKTDNQTMEETTNG